MRSRVIILVMVTVLAGCSGLSESRLNPLNWFGKGKDEAAQRVDADPVDPALLDPRPLIGNIAEVRLERAAGGAILRATGIAATQGYYGAELVPLAFETPVNGALVYFFRVRPPASPAATGSPRTRTVTVARFLPDSVLDRTRSVVVRGQTNQRRASR